MILRIRGPSLAVLVLRFPHLNIVLNLATIETAAFALSYDSVVRIMTQRAARKRGPSVDLTKFLCDDNDEVGDI